MFRWMRLITIPHLTFGRRGWAVMVHTLFGFWNTHRIGTPWWVWWFWYNERERERENRVEKMRYSAT